jgi:hypothetical protein
MVTSRWPVALLALVALSPLARTARAQNRITDVVIEATRETDPQSPQQLLTAVRNLLNVGAND